MHADGGETQGKTTEYFAVCHRRRMGHGFVEEATKPRLSSV